MVYPLSALDEAQENFKNAFERMRSAGVIKPSIGRQSMAEAAALFTRPVIGSTHS
jgi:hypothetical protein